MSMNSSYVAREAMKFTRIASNDVWPILIIHMNPCNLFLNPKSHLFHLSRGDGTTHSPGNCREISGGKLIQDNGMVRNISSQVRLTGLKNSFH